MRIVSLCPSTTELVFALGRGSDLIGVTRFCVRPAEAVAAIEKVGGTKNPKIGRIVEMAPDLVLFNDEENRAEDFAKLRDAGVSCLSTMPKTIQETADSVRVIGRALGRGAAAERIAVDIEESARAATDRTRGVDRVPYAYLIWREPWMTVNDDTYVAALLGTAGGRNVFANRRDRYPEVATREISSTGPRAVLMSSEPYPFTDKHAKDLANATGLGRDRFLLVDGERLSWHGARTCDGIEYAVALLDGIRALDR